jgi:hypothetical protein
VSVEALAKIEDARATIGMGGGRLRLPGVDPSPNIEDRRNAAVVKTLNSLMTAEEPTVTGPKTSYGAEPFERFDPSLRQSQMARDLGYWDIDQARDNYSIGRSGSRFREQRPGKGDYGPNPEPK